MREWNGIKCYSKKENEQLYNDIRSYNSIIKEDLKKRLTGEGDCDTIARALLDSSLIFATTDEIYTHKIVQCGKYYQIYDYNKKTIKKNSSAERMNYQNRQRKKIFKEVGECSKQLSLDCSKQLFLKSDDFLNWSKTSFGRDPPKWLHMNEKVIIKKNENEKKILKRNVHRSKIELERLIKSNEEIFKTFITLTIADNVTDINEANKIFSNFRTQIQRKLKKQKKEFSYVCVPEFQKRGAVHYHLLTNLDVKENSDIIILQKNFTEKQMQTMTEKQRNKCYDLIFWKSGFCRVDELSNINNVVGYISKYMTKDIDNRLWGKRRYLASHNLKTPSTLFINLESDRGFLQILDIKNNCDLKFQSIYANQFGEVINFDEFKLKERKC